MKERLEQIKAEAVARIQEADVPEKLNDVRVKFLGKKGELTAVLKGMKDVAPEERPKVGQMVNETRAAIESILEESKAKLERAIREEKLKQEVIDVTLPSTTQMSITLIDATGSAVATIVNGAVTSGTHRFMIEATTVSSGVYHLLTVINGVPSMQSVMIIK